MPVIGSGTFTIHGFSAVNPFDGWFYGPDGSGGYHYYCTLLGPAVPTKYVAAGPSILDTSNHGTGLSPAAPPPGFNPSTNLHVNTALGGVGGANPSLGTIEYGSLTGSLTSFTGNFPDYSNYGDLLSFLRITITSHGTTDAPSERTNATYFDSDVSVTGHYDIIAFWWTLPEKDKCGNEQTPRLVLSPDKPGDGYERLDPDDPDAAPQPVIYSVEPDHGLTTGNTEVVIRGDGFGDDANVKFDATNATGITVVSSKEIRCTSPAHAVGDVNVSVINPDGVSS